MALSGTVEQFDVVEHIMFPLSTIPVYSSFDSFPLEWREELSTAALSSQLPWLVVPAVRLLAFK
jgi:hypothetical protein